MSHLIFQTSGDAVGLLLRLTVAVVMFPHGAQKLLGWFGGYGPSPTLQYFRSLGIPTVAGGLGILAESVGPVLLVLGLGTRVVALLLAGVMVFAALLVHKDNGFFMNWGGKLQAGQEGFEFHILALGALAALFVTGGGAFSLDALLAR
ncbi:MAG TPA: DoxX family protein [Gemmatimonadales bacterium]|nr:DoxX family protein [Gemmatimonadales bacterium]